MKKFSKDIENNINNNQSLMRKSPNLETSSDDSIELNGNKGMKLNLYIISNDIFDRIQNEYPSNTINKTEIYKTFNYTLSDIKSKCFKTSDILKRAEFYFSLYHSLNKECNKKLLEIYKYNKAKLNKYKYLLEFSNLSLTNDKTNEFNQSENNLQKDGKKSDSLYNNILNPPFLREKSFNQMTMRSFDSFNDSEDNNSFGINLDSEKSNEIIIETIKLSSSSRSSDKKNLLSEENIINNFNNHDIYQMKSLNSFNIKRNYEDDFVSKKRKKNNKKGIKIKKSLGAIIIKLIEITFATIVMMM